MPSKTHTLTRNAILSGAAREERKAPTLTRPSLPPPQESSLSGLFGTNGDSGIVSASLTSGAGGAIADLLDLQSELSSLQKGLSELSQQRAQQNQKVLLVWHRCVGMVDGGHLAATHSLYIPLGMLARRGSPLHSCPLGVRRGTKATSDNSFTSLPRSFSLSFSVRPSFFVPS